MRVVAATVFFPRGGSAFVARELARALDADVTLVAGSTTEHDARSFFAGLDVRPVDFAPALRSAAPVRYAGGPGEAPIHGSFEDRAAAPDPVFARLDDAAYALQVDAWARALRSADAAGADVLHLHHLTPLNAAAQYVAPGVPVVGHLHGTELLMLEAIEGGAGWAHGAAWAERLRAWAAACARLVVAPGSVARATELLGLAPERLVVLPNGFDPDVFGPREVDRAAVWRRALPDAPDVAGGPVIVYVGRFVEVKRLPLLIEAFSAAREQLAVPVSLVLVGDPDEEETIDGLGVEGVHLAGWHEHHDLADLLAASDALALASAHESFGQVIVEAMACGVVPVVTAAEGPARIVEDGETGWVVPVDDPAALAAALVAAVSKPAERARRAARAAEVARERFTWPAIARELLGVLSDAQTATPRDAASQSRTVG